MPDAVIDVAAAYVLLPVGLLMLAVGLRGRPHTRRHTLWVAAGTLYALAVLDATLFPMQLMLGDTGNQAAWWSQVNPIPLVTMSPGSFILNIVLFLPLGALLAIAPRPVSLREATTIGLACSALIEAVQLTLDVAASLGRSADVNDLLANTLGAVVAFVLTRALIGTLLADHGEASPHQVTEAGL